MTIEPTSTPEESLVPPFPFQTIKGKRKLPSREHLESTAEYLRQHGDCRKLQLQEQKRIISKSMALQLKSEFPDVKDQVLGQILYVYKDAVDKVFR